MITEFLFRAALQTSSSFESCPKPLQLIICGCSICFFFSLSSYVFKFLCNDLQFNYPAFLTLAQFIVVTLLCLPSLHRTIFSKKTFSANFYIYIFTSVVLLLSITFDNFAVVRLRKNYATEALFKSPKALPVLVGNIVFLKKTFTVTEIVAVCVIVSGFVGMSLGDFSDKRANFDISGITAIVISVALEAIAANMEEHILVLCGATMGEAMSLIFSLGTIMIFIWSIATGEFFDALKKLIEGPSKTTVYLAIYAMTGAVGMHFIFLAIKVLGSLQTIVFTSLRKMINNIISFFVFPEKTFTKWHTLSLLLVALGFSVNFVEKVNAGRKNEQCAQTMENATNYIILESGTQGLLDDSGGLAVGIHSDNIM